MPLWLADEAIKAVREGLDAGSDAMLASIRSRVDTLDRLRAEAAGKSGKPAAEQPTESPAATEQPAAEASGEPTASEAPASEPAAEPPAEPAAEPAPATDPPADPPADPASRS